MNQGKMRTKKMGKNSRSTKNMWRMAALTALAGCGSQATGGTSGNGSPSNMGANGSASGSGTGSPITVGVVTSLSGALAEYGKEWQRGFEIGLQYATQGTDAVDGHKIQVIWKDDGTDPNRAVTAAKTLFQNDHINILAGGVNSASAIAIEPLAKRYQTVYVVGPAVADSITGEYYNKYIFKVSPNSFMEAMAAAIAIVDGLNKTNGNSNGNTLSQALSGMSLGEATEVLDLVTQLKNSGQYGMILVEHKLEVVLKMSHRVMVLHQGRQLAVGSPDEVMANPAVEKAYLGGYHGKLA
ncbi:hypothetical protein D2Q93_09190 [Alicyclobacillaceae bacterium I2511]|nr:hypothetical protein D2Q93_09190 [Alicyclobacillaceae bacterium I2511]